MAKPVGREVDRWFNGFDFHVVAKQRLIDGKVIVLRAEEAWQLTVQSRAIAAPHERSDADPRRKSSAGSAQMAQHSTDRRKVRRGRREVGHRRAGRMRVTVMKSGPK